jgi:hypothetical protein
MQSFLLDGMFLLRMCQCLLDGMFLLSVCLLGSMFQQMNHLHMFTHRVDPGTYFLR